MTGELFEPDKLYLFLLSSSTQINDYEYLESLETAT